MSSRTHRRRVLKGALLAALAPQVIISNAAQSSTADPEPPRTGFSTTTLRYWTLQTRDGLLRGVEHDGIFSFKGVPYGAPPDGANRFAPPQKPSPWSGVRDALAFGPIAPQENPWEKIRKFTAHGYEGTIPIEAAEINEDCLRLNVWARALAESSSPRADDRRPVMVWIHGGSLIGGSGGADWYDGANLSRRGDVVVVTVNHRLGALGYLHTAELAGGDAATSGALGMLDLVAALEWVRDNIAAFGGDPRNVTIFGESGGGWKVSTLLAMPAARGLFHRAIIQSGALLRGHTQEQAMSVTRLMLQELGVEKPTLDQLRKIPIDRLIAAQQRLVTRVRGGELPGISHEFRPVIGTATLPKHPFDPVAPEISANIPLLIGTNGTEASWGLWADPGAASMTDAELHRRLTTALQGDPRDAIALYRTLQPGATPRELYIAILSSPHESIRLAERKAQGGGAPVYMYSFAWRTPVLDGQLGSPHMLEVPFVFDNISAARGFTGDSPQTRQLASNISAAWAQFARSGVPSARGLPAWPPFTPKDRLTLVFDDRSSVVEDPDAQTRRFWHRIAPQQ